MCFSNDSFWVGMNSAAQGYFHKEVKHVINNIELEVQVTTIVITIVKADCKLLLPHIRKVQGGATDVQLRLNKKQLMLYFFYIMF